MMAATLILGGAASILGIWYSMLGISAIKHLHKADEVDKVVGWTLWWCFDTERYDDEGRRLCKKGQLVAMASVALWVAAYAVRG